MDHKAGFVNILGNPNVGKSTLMNNLVGEKLSIITSKSQTTRHRIMGIVNGADFQIVYSDTPGIIKPNYKLQESMMMFVETALNDADIILYVTDVKEKLDKNIDYIEKVKKSHAPVILIINKIDLASQDVINVLIEKWKNFLPKAIIIPTSATEVFNLEKVFDNILELLPSSPPYFPEDELTDKSKRFFASEIIREKILLNYKQEIPYSVEVVIEEFKDSDKIIHIRSLIYVTRESQKGIIIGHKGKALKKVGSEARLDLESFFENKVFLEIYVKVSREWRNKPKQLLRFGYR